MSYPFVTVRKKKSPEMERRIGIEACRRWNMEFDPGLKVEFIPPHRKEAPVIARTSSKAFMTSGIDSPLIRIEGFEHPVDLYKIAPHHERVITRQEADVLKLLVKGLNAVECATVLRIKKGAAQMRAEKMTAKVGHSRADLIRFAYEEGLASDPDAHGS